MAQLILKALIAKSMNVDGYIEEMTEVAKKEADKIEKEFRKVSDTFSGSDRRYSGKPQYKKKFGIEGGSLIASTTTDDERMLWLNWGTKERWAIMSDDWQSKTRVLRLSTNAGRGRVVARGRRAMQQARRGITARRFDIAIRLKRQVPFQLNAVKAMARAARKTF